MVDPQPIYSGSSDDDLQKLLNQLAGPASQEEAAAAGVGSGPGGTKFNLGRGWKGSARDVGQHVSLWGAQKAGKKKHKFLAKQRAERAAQAQAYNAFLADRNQRLAQVQQEIKTRDQGNRINAYFSSGSMQGLYDKLANQHLQNSLSQITQQYGDLNRNQAFQTADQGLEGSSVDAARRGDIQQGQDAATIQAQGQAQQYAQGVKNQNEQQRQSLLGTLRSGNPADAGVYNQQMQTISNQTSAMGNQYSGQMANYQINQAGNNMQSQALGNLMSNYANLYRAGQQGAAYNQQQNAANGQQGGSTF